VIRHAPTLPMMIDDAIEFETFVRMHMFSEPDINE
jgi:hypothetical protein